MEVVASISNCAESRKTEAKFSRIDHRTAAPGRSTPSACIGLANDARL